MTLQTLVATQINRDAQRLRARLECARLEAEWNVRDHDRVKHSDPIMARACAEAARDGIREIQAGVRSMSHDRRELERITHRSHDHLSYIMSRVLVAFMSRHKDWFPGA